MSEVAEKKQITVSSVLQDLENGMTREEIAEKHELRPGHAKALFSHPQIKGKKTKKKAELPFEIVDDISGNVEEDATIIEEGAGLDFSEDQQV